MTRSLALIVVVAGSLAPACYGAPPDGGGGDPLTDPECQLDTEGEKEPGFPYDVARFTNEVMPIVTGSCALAGCHGAPTGQGDFTVWKDAQPGDCDFGKTFNNVVRKVDLTTPANSRIVAAVSGGSATHPFSFATDAASLDVVEVTGEMVNPIDLSSVESTSIFTEAQFDAVPVARNVTGVALLGESRTTTPD